MGSTRVNGEFLGAVYRTLRSSRGVGGAVWSLGEVVSRVVAKRVCPDDVGLSFPLVVFNALSGGDGDVLFEMEGTRPGRVCLWKDGDGGRDCVDEDACCDKCDIFAFTRTTPPAPSTTEPLSSLESVDCGGDSAVRRGTLVAGAVT